MPTCFNRWESVCVLIAVALTPFWFINFGGINLGPSHILFLVAGTSYSARTGIYEQVPSRLLLSTFVLFLGALIIGVLISPFRLKALLNFLQYVFLLWVAVPVLYRFLRNDRRNQWHAFLGLFVVLNVISVVAFVRGYIYGVRFDEIYLLYDNQNQMYWLIASAFLGNIALSLEKEKQRTRLLSLCLALVALSVLIRGDTLSAYLQIVGGIWLLVMLQIPNSVRFLGIGPQRTQQLFVAGTVIVGLVGTVLVTLFWDVVTTEGSLSARIPQYLTALEIGLRAFPLGTGLESSELYLGTSVHNYFLAYLLEIGILGAGAFTLLLVVWIRNVVFGLYRQAERLNPFVTWPVAVFSGYILVMFLQPVPVRLFWWVAFGFGWAIVGTEVSTSEGG